MSVRDEWRGVGQIPLALEVIKVWAKGRRRGACRCPFSGPRKVACTKLVRDDAVRIAPFSPLISDHVS